MYDRYDGANKCKFSEQFRTKKLETKSFPKETKRTRKIEQSSPEYIRQKGKRRLVAEFNKKIAFVKGWLNFSNKSTTAPNVRLMESILLDN